MITTETKEPRIGSTVTHRGRPGRVVGTELVERGDALRRPAGRCLLLRFDDESIEWVTDDTKGTT